MKLRKESPVLTNPSKEQMEVRAFENEKALFVRRWSAGENLFCLYNFSGTSVTITLTLPEGRWVRVLESSSEEWGGQGTRASESLDSNGTKVSVSLDPYGLVLYRTVGT